MNKTVQPDIAFYLPSLRGGGAERVTVTLASGFVARGHAVDIVLAQAEGAYLSDLHPDVRVVDLRARRVLSSLPGLVRYLRRARPQAIMSSMWHANIIVILGRWLSGSKARLVVREASTPSINMATLPAWQRGAYRRLIGSHYRMADCIIAPSSGVAMDLHQYIGLAPEKIAVVPNPVIHPGLFEKAQLPPSHPWFVEDALPVILSVGRLGAEKDFPTLVRAFARVQARYPARLMILGEGSERPLLENLARELGIAETVAFPGFVDNPWSYMSRAAVYVLTSRFEGLPGALIEAMAMGCPVVATDCPSGPREILADGKYGQLVPVGDVEALSLAILDTLKKPRQPYPEAAFAPFRLERVLDTYEQLLMGAAIRSDLKYRDAT